MPKLYTKNTWVDEVLAGAERYDIKENGGTTFKSNMQIVLATSVSQAGTLVDADKMNNLEDGLDAIDTALSSGWQPVTQTWTYASADAPVYQIYVSGNVTANDDYKLGNKIKCTISSAIKYGIIVKIGSYDSGNNRTPVDIYCGTDYTITNSAISSPYISKIKSPDGFPMDATKWDYVALTDSTDRTKSSPITASAFYYSDFGSLNFNVPIGSWRLRGKGILSVYRDTAGTGRIQVALSTANNSFSDTKLVVMVGIYGTATGEYQSFNTAHWFKDITVTSKTPYYVVVKTPDTNITQLSLLNGTTGFPLEIVLECAYL